MAQTNYTPILLYASGTATNVPLAANLTSSASGAELALNYADGKLFYKDNSGTVQVLATKGAGTIGGSNTQVQYNNAGALAGSANFTFNGTTVTMANDASISGLTVGKGAGAVSSNTAVGASALAANSTNSNIVAIGNQALTNSTSNQCVAVGSQAMFSNTTGFGEAFGFQALYTNTTGSNNTAIGYRSQYLNTTGGNNVSVGLQSLYNNTTASNNTAVGYQSLLSNTTASFNTAVGYVAGQQTTTGHITALGSYALQNNTIGSGNTAVGGNDGTIDGALYLNTTGSYNTAMGTGALKSNTTGIDNTAIGYQSLYNNNNSYNTAIGYQAGVGCTSGQQNIYIGYVAGANHATGTACIYINAEGGLASSSSVSNELLIATQSPTGKGANTGFISPNGGGVYQGNNSTLWSVTSDQRLKKNIVDNTVGLTAINGIKVRNFEYRLPDEITDLDKSNAVAIAGVQLGPIAQELQQILPDCVKTESTGVMSVDSSDVLWHLVTAVQQLSAQVTALQAKVGV